MESSHSSSSGPSRSFRPHVLRTSGLKHVKSLSDLMQSSSTGSANSAGTNDSAAHMSLANPVLRSAVPKLLQQAEERRLRQGRLLLVSLLENFCVLYDQSPDRNRRLFFAICKQLSAMGIISSDDFIDEMTSVRANYKQAFKELVTRALFAIQEEQLSQKAITYDQESSMSTSSSSASQVPNSLVLARSMPARSATTFFSPITHDFSDILDLQVSRYREDFQEIRVLGHGAFGVVCCARNMLDSMDYAVKKIRLRAGRKAKLEKILREVKFQARLTHANVVRYYSAWFEHSESHPNPRLLDDSFGIGGDLGSSLEDYEDDDNSDAMSESLSESQPSGRAFPPFGARSSLHSQQLSSMDRAVPSIPRSASPMKEVKSSPLRSPARSGRPSHHADVGDKAAVSFYLSESEGSGANRWTDLDDSATDADTETDADADTDTDADTDDSADYIQADASDTDSDSESASSSNMDSVSDDSTHGLGELNIMPSSWTAEAQASSKDRSSTTQASGKSSAGDTLSIVESLSIRSAGDSSPTRHLTLFIQMELCSSTLQDWLVRRNAKSSQLDDVDQDECLRIFTEVVEGLAYVHSQGCIHRDIKPKNIYWKPDVADDTSTAARGHWKIGDFGLVTAAGENLFHQSTHESHPTPHNPDRTTGVGTGTYASPEQLHPSENVPYTSKSDVYSLGIILFELLQPFSTAMERAMALKALRDGVLPEAFVRKWPKETTLILWLASADPSQRPSAEDLLNFELLQFSSRGQHGAAGCKGSSIETVSRGIQVGLGDIRDDFYYSHLRSRSYDRLPVGHAAGCMPPSGEARHRPPHPAAAGERLTHRSRSLRMDLARRSDDYAAAVELARKAESDKVAAQRENLLLKERIKALESQLQLQQRGHENGGQLKL